MHGEGHRLPTMRKSNWCGWLAITLCLLGKAGAQVVVATTALGTAVAQRQRALTAIVNGDPKVYEALFADSENINRGNPFGPFANGRAEVVKTLG